MNEKIIKIGLDLDGVIIDKPPIIPKSLLEWLVRSHKSRRLAYRYPRFVLERALRWLTHHPFFRPPIKENLELIKKFKRNSYQLYVISGRYSFLEGRTKQWLHHYHLENYFEGVFINLKNEQPHLFKEKKIKELDIDLFIDDDLPICEYLSPKFLDKKIVCFERWGQKLGDKSSLLNSLIRKVS